MGPVKKRRQSTATEIKSTVKPLLHPVSAPELQLGSTPTDPTLAQYVREKLKEFIGKGSQKVIPALAKNKLMLSLAEAAISHIPTMHRIIKGDARSMEHLSIRDESVHLVVTSPPYWILKEYNPHEAQLGS